MENELSFSQPLNSGTHSMAIHGGMDLITGARFIVTNGTEQPIDIPIHWQCPIGILQRTFERIETLINDSQNCFRDLISAYADLYNIGLYLIVCNGNTCAIIGKEELESNKRHNYEHYTFLWCHAANMVFSPVYIQHINGHKMTTFKTDDVRARDFIESYLDGINQNLINPDQNSVEQDSAEQDALMSEHVSHMMVDTAFSTTDDRTSRVRQPITTVNARVSIKQMQEEIDQLIPFIISRSIEVGFENPIPDFNSTNLNQIPPKMVAELIQERLLYLSNAVQKALELTSQDSDTGISSMIVGEENNQQLQTNETNHSVQTNQGFSYVSSSEPIDMLNSNQASQSTSVSTSLEFQYETPSILVQPKGEWHNRNMKELANKGVSRLAADGPQRTFPQVQVPPKKDQDMYLTVQILTYNNEKHPSKVLVPENTDVNMDGFCNDNNLSRLLFDKCKKQNNYCEPGNGCVYLGISPEEHQAQRKHVRIRMFNLYQTGSITKELIEANQLKKCKLAFWLCILQDGVFKPISNVSLSSIIEET
ncbi:unnamed protein product [Adineta steineri]|uniref:Uncharacterized protein n=1 Tax=Adineta steineri TaxID=433720 RepID=A0A818UGV9_9BILA|nr:unnamed protein product [Adineta steineri]